MAAAWRRSRRTSATSARPASLVIEDDRGSQSRGKEALHDLVEQWRYGGTPIDEVGHRREAFNIMLSMPRGTDPGIVLRAAREFARDELEGHRYVMVLHDHQANPHVHLSVKASSMRGDRLNPRKADLHRWRETFAEKLRGYGIEAEASRQASRGVLRNADPLWRLRAKEGGRLLEKKPDLKGGRSKIASWAARCVTSSGDNRWFSGRCSSLSASLCGRERWQVSRFDADPRWSAEPLSLLS